MTPYFQTSENPDLQNIIIHNGSLCFAFTDSFLSEKTEWNLYYWDSVIATIPCFLSTIIKQLASRPPASEAAALISLAVCSIVLEGSLLFKGWNI